jgi:CxxC-x17-CxxC domain-containing protein
MTEINKLSFGGIEITGERPFSLEATLSALAAYGLLKLPVVEPTSRAANAEPTKKSGYEIVCDKCGFEAVVPFKPNPNKPVKCEKCYKEGGTRWGN